MAWMVCKPRNSGGWSHRLGLLCPCLLRSVVCHIQECVTNRFFYALIERCGKGDMREGCHGPQGRHVAKWHFSISSEGTFWFTFPVRRLVWKWSLYLAGCLFWVIINALALMHTHCSFMFSWAEGIISPYVWDSSAVWGFFGVLWIILNLAFVPDFFHLINFLNCSRVLQVMKRIAWVMS